MSGTGKVYPDGTASILYMLAENPRINVQCSLGDSPAVAIFHTPGGCVARRGDVIQALCEAHMESAGVIGSITLLLDLTIGAAWSKENERTPLLCLGFTVAELEKVLRSLGVALR